MAICMHVCMYAGGCECVHAGRHTFNIYMCYWFILLYVYMCNIMNPFRNISFPDTQDIPSCYLLCSFIFKWIPNIQVRYLPRCTYSRFLMTTSHF